MASSPRPASGRGAGSSAASRYAGAALRRNATAQTPPSALRRNATAQTRPPPSAAPRGRPPLPPTISLRRHPLSPPVSSINGTTSHIFHCISLFPFSIHEGSFSIHEGSTDTRDHPKLVSIAMDLAQEMNGCFFGASVFSGLLKAKFNAHFWSTALAIVKEFKRVNLSLFGDKCADLWQALEPVFLRRVNTTSSEYLVIVHDYETGFDQDSDQSEGSQSQMSIRDLLFGSSNFRPRGRFGVLAWTSHIPPHYRYMMNCEVRRSGRVISSKKPIQQIAS